MHAFLVVAYEALQVRAANAAGVGYHCGLVLALLVTTQISQKGRMLVILPAQCTIFRPVQVIFSMIESIRKGHM